MPSLLANTIRIYIAIVEQGSITSAADRLGMGKSGISDALKQLETALGAQLIVRTTRKQSLTTIGEKFYQRCRELNDLSTVALEEVSEHLAEPVGPLRITAPHAIVDRSVAPALAALVAKHPRVEPELIVDDQRLDLVKNKIDLALTVGELPDSEFKVQRIGTVKDVLCASPGFCSRVGLVPEGKPKPEILRNLPYVAHKWEGGDIVHRLKRKTGGNLHVFRFQRVATASSVHAVEALIQKGLGLGVLPHLFLQERLDRGELVEVFPNYEPRASGIYAIHPYGAVPPMSVRAMIDTVKQMLGRSSGS